MFPNLFSLFRLGSVTNTIIRSFRSDKRIQFRQGINRPPKIFISGEERLDSLPDEETRIWREQRSLYNIDRRGPPAVTLKRHPLDFRPQMKGVVLKTIIKKPKKPNSANRKCVFIRLSNGKEAAAYVPGIGHNLQEHSNVLVKFHKTKDVPGLKLKVIRGVYDCSLDAKTMKKLERRKDKVLYSSI